MRRRTMVLLMFYAALLCSTSGMGLFLLVDRVLGLVALIRELTYAVGGSFLLLAIAFHLFSVTSDIREEEARKKSRSLRAVRRWVWMKAGVPLMITAFLLVVLALYGWPLLVPNPSVSTLELIGHTGTTLLWTFIVSFLPFGVYLVLAVPRIASSLIRRIGFHT